ncbi:zinc finger and BTB domain-containing protein 26-like [Daktulosphaira vitifoliae]|uniref:zinc finger and BTB domain-containing protein 26-like n=1 Tax=Daktulosphaira vitifoliae TaxID=58002 RepID=UPI0021A9A7F8|nr:zinc finger and BTB domain-containing protein 26-like [Daktulosphaira vitifoliae]XP_050542125.1 zinc finger and BTB domain-containing protein 26-like [Daktulosphaira vitifoliae]
MTADHFCLKWNNYPLNMVTELDSLRTSEDLVDVTLSCDGQLFKAHKVVLSMCSTYFRNVFKDNPCKHPVVILKDVNQDDVKALLNFVYQGTVYISEKKLTSFLRTAELLQIRGLAGAASTINTDLESTRTSLEKNTVPPLQQISTNNNKIDKQETCTSTATVKTESPKSPNGKVSAKRKKGLPIKFKKSSEDGLEYMDETTNGSETDILSRLKVDEIDDSGNGDGDCYIDEDISKDGFSDDRYVQGADIGDEFDDVELEKEDENSHSNTAFEKSLIASRMLNDPKDIRLSGSGGIDFAIAPAQTNQSVSDQSLSTADRLGRRPCPLCQKVISNKSNLLKHMRIRHSDEYNPAGCSVCGKVFKNKYSLRAHINIYHKDHSNNTNLGGGGNQNATAYQVYSNNTVVTHQQQQHQNQMIPQQQQITNNSGTYLTGSSAVTCFNQSQVTANSTSGGYIIQQQPTSSPFLNKISLDLPSPYQLTNQATAGPPLSPL